MPIWKKFIHSLGQIMKGRSLSKKSSKKKKLSRKKGLLTKRSKNKSSLKKKRFPPPVKNSSLKRKEARKVLPKEEKAVPLGEITHFFSRIQVVVVKITKGEISVGDELHIKGKATDFIQKVNSLQIESVDVKKAHRGQLAGLKVDKQARPGDKVFKVLSV